MTTRRDRDLPSHPSTSPGGRPRIPEREITDTDVTQHAQEVLTDQDFLITSPSVGDYFRHDGSEWVNQAGVPAADITAGVFGPGDFTIQGALRLQTDATVFQRFTRTDLTDLSWDFRLGTGGVFELRAVEDAGSTVGRVFNISHDTQRVTFDVGINEAAVTEHQAALSVAFSQLTGNIASGQVPEAAVTQHQAALAIAESQITDGSILARLAADETVTGSWTFEGIPTVQQASGDHLRLDSSEEDGDLFISFRQVGSLKARLWYLDSVDALLLHNEYGPVWLYAGESDAATNVARFDKDAPLLHLRLVSGELLRLDDSSSTGSPYLSFYQSTTRRAYIQFHDSGQLRLVPEEGNVWIWPTDGTNEILRLRHNSSAGSPYLSFYQAGTLRAYMQFHDSIGLLIKSEQMQITLRNPAGDDWEFQTDGDLLCPGDVIATVP